jgi:general secretion pathway protein N
MLITLILQAPAAWLALALSAATAGKLELPEARGTVWTGSARLQFSGGAGSSDRSILPGRINWSIRPTLDGLSIHLGADCCIPEPLALRVSPGWGSVCWPGWARPGTPCSWTANWACLHRAFQ